MTTLREAIQQALEALVQIHPGNMTPMAEEAWNKAIVMLGDALAEQPAEQSAKHMELVRGEWQGYTWNPYAISQPKEHT